MASGACSDFESYFSWGTELTSAVQSKEGITISLSHDEALVFFEWLARNWERTQWEQAGLFSDPAEKQLLVSIEGDLSPLIAEVFSGAYQDHLRRAYRSFQRCPKG